MLLQELNHRVKNTLATVQSLARRTFKGDGTGRYERFEGRLLSLSITHNLLTASEWQGAKLIDIVEAEWLPTKVSFATMALNFSCRPCSLGFVDDLP